MRLVHSGAALRDRNITAILDAVDATRSDVDARPLPHAERSRIPRRGSRQGGRQRAHHAARPRAIRRPVATLNAHDVGIHILPPVNFNNRWALPNKFFDYVQARLGVIIGPSPEMARVLTHARVRCRRRGFQRGRSRRSARRARPRDGRRLEAGIGCLGAGALRRVAGRGVGPGDRPTRRGTFVSRLLLFTNDYPYRRVTWSSSRRRSRRSRRGSTTSWCSATRAAPMSAWSSCRRR